MTKLQRLKREARAAATARGHTLARFNYWHGGRYYAYCSQCGEEALVRERPAPNEIEIGGEAVALNCKGSQ